MPAQGIPSAASLRINVRGRDGIVMKDEARFSANLFAPNASVGLRAGVAVEGQIAAKTITTGPGVILGLSAIDVAPTPPPPAKRDKREIKIKLEFTLPLYKEKDDDD